jgi:DNA polymerase-3 subunit epsilon
VETINVAELRLDDPNYDVSSYDNNPDIVRELVLDTETTGFFYDVDDRVIEIGIVELVNRNETGRVFHLYIDPQRDVPEEAYAVHGLSRDDLVRLSNGKRFADIVKKLVKFIGKATLVAHNANFDMNFLNAELKRCGQETFKEKGNKIIDSLLTANLTMPNQANNLTAICNRLLGPNNYSRELHGALLDATLLAKVYRIMTIQQVTLQLDGVQRLPTAALTPERLDLPAGVLKKAKVSEDDLARHSKLCERINKSSGGNCLALSIGM